MIRAALMALVIATATRPQSAPRFVTAEIRPSKEIRESRGRFLPNGDVAVLNTTLKELITVAYSLQDNMIAGGPPWIAIDHYDLIAKAPPNTPMDTLRLMLRSLVAERFKLTVHTENRTMPVYALVVAKSPPMLAPARGGAQDCRWTGSNRECRNLTMADLALQLPAWSKTKLDRPVVDLTGLKGAYDFTTVWKDAGTTVPDALAQLGLKLDPRTHAVPVVVVDRAIR